MNNNNLNILLTSVGRRSYLVEYFKEAMKGVGKVYASNSTSLSSALQYADDYTITPLIYDSSYIPFLLEYCKFNSINAIISLFDADLPILARNRNEFAKIGTTIIVSDSDVIDICNDKWNTFQFLSHNKLDVPKTYLTIESALMAMRDNKITYPLIIKPRWGMGSIGLYEAENDNELEVLYNVAKRDVLNTYLKYESSQYPDNCVLIQEKITGTEYGLDIINNLNGDYQTTVCKQKYAMRSGETDCAVTVDNNQLRYIGKTLSHLLHHIGNLDCDLIASNGKYFIIDINARFGGGYPFSHMAGVNLVEAIVNWLRGITVTPESLTPQYGIKVMKDINPVYITNHYSASNIAK